MLSDLVLRYPFAPGSRQFFETIPVDESLASREVVAQAELRLMSSLGRVRYEPHISELTEFSSFFAAALVAAQDPVLTSRFSKKEAERAREFFLRETGEGKLLAMRDCLGIPADRIQGERGAESVIPFEVYLTATSRFQLGKNPKWKLAKQELGGGAIYMVDNLLNDFFGDCAQGAIGEGVRNLRRGQFPKQLASVRDNVIKFVPAPKPKSGKGYLYVEDLMKHPVSDGRHRLVWLVLAPYLVNVKQLDDEQAVDKIRAFVAFAGETGQMRRFVEYNVRRARRNGLLPPTFSKLRAEHPDVFSLLPKEVVAAQTAEKGPKQPS